MTSLGDIAQLIIALSAAFGAWQAWQAKREAAAAKRQSAENAVMIETVHKATNSLTDQLVVSTALASFREGTAAGLEQGRKESK